MIPEVIGAAMAVLVAALPPPPQNAVRETKSYGTVTVPHAKHLAARVACHSCHGPGRVRKIKFTPKSAHAACRNCHVEVKRGPVDCRGCHVLPPKATTELAATTPAASQTATPVSMPDAAGRIPAMVALVPGLGEDAVFTKTAELGFVAIAARGEAFIAGPAMQLSARNGSRAMTFGVAYAEGRRNARTQILVGAGRGWMLAPTLRGTALAVGGLDATHSPITLMPAVGARASLEFVRRSPWMIGISATGLYDVVRGDNGGERTGGATFSAGVALGYGLR